MNGRNSTDENHNELELLRIENKDLTEKLETLRLKRKQDHPKLVEYDKNVAELNALRDFKTKMLESNKRLQRTLQEKEKELGELVKSSHEKEEWVTEIEHRLELMTIEKEVAEEKAELLQGDIEAEKQRAQNLEDELKALRSQIEKTGEDLAQACFLLSLRDFSSRMTEDKRKLEQENEKLSDETAKLVKICENLQKDLQTAEQNITTLREQIDANLESENIIEALTQKNDELEKKLSALEETVEDFESIRTMDEEIIEAQKENEKELKNDLDLANGRNNDARCFRTSSNLKSKFFPNFTLFPSLPLFEKQELPWVDGGVSFCQQHLITDSDDDALLFQNFLREN
ncbi:unnamed protein product [Gongylonema pulchrum]|uniref:Uncharacterized protein n=1 Tax=Gongylonema pulchrum TaxID=637853 RepID=A0A183DXB5_9BILA|nr:unnamed protein product [Gongylonema pulchrum]